MVDIVLPLLSAIPNSSAASAPVPSESENFTTAIWLARLTVPLMVALAGPTFSLAPLDMRRSSLEAIVASVPSCEARRSAFTSLLARSTAE